MTAPILSVIIPTLRRPVGLDQAVQSIFAQDLSAMPGPVQLIIADNDPAGSALDQARALAAAAPGGITVDVLHEPSPGVANVRNTAVAAVRAPLIAFLDDDQTAPPDWLAALLAGHASHPAAVSFGPISTVLPDGVKRYTRYFDAFFDRTGPSATGYITYFFGCGNALLDLTRISVTRPLFDRRANETGGEDDLLFERIRASGGKFAWIAPARVREHVPAHRAHLRYTLRRALAYGQGPTHSAFRGGPSKWPLVPANMLIGVLQFTACSLLGALLLLVRHDGAAYFLDKASRGLGKVFWWSSFKFRFYGQRGIDIANRSGTAEGAGEPAQSKS